ncbi:MULTISPECIES: Qat anti-phage system TatD family nuclease QatD [unclassified Methylobacterium]|uniref:Qat anti-phage system TatD family nuclease QatD n=1 Tax=unclassified Methylobacterium TaxID=2615210 RepID=UPI0011C1D88F|nr:MULTISPECIES: Qat anti-phage system TatD family nuclease QatD [unclassified Methylobacterium]QEE41010.1 TatD family deoxyribonuclease [Methylobacterium sp. WL1]TXN58857.1 TatD family deoxyribonuclease [Methylobacterium sp. WL2]
MIDFHCHLDLYTRPAEVIAEVARRGTYVLAVTTTPRAFEGNLRYVGDVARIRVAVGLHPELVRERHHEVGLVCATLVRTRYVGEVGLDGSPDHRSSMGLQREVLRRILGTCASQGGRIVSLHSRMAASQVLDEIEVAGAAAMGTPVMHWYSGSPKELLRAMDLGCWFSVGPAMLASRNGRTLAALMPRDRVLPETDGPFGQADGKPLSPWDAERVVPILADLWDEPAHVVSSTLRSNLRRLVA